MRSLLCLLLLFTCCTASLAQESSLLERARRLAAQQRWSDVVTLLRTAHTGSADLEYLYGSALARLERWPEAHSAFESGRRLQPRDKRFPQELAGVAFREKKYSRAADYAQDAVRLDPSDSYTNDLLGTIYFLQGNLEAALKYWNRVNKPQIRSVLVQPEPKIDPALLDNAFAFAPATIFTAPELLTSDMRVGGLGIFPSYHFDLQARDDGNFDLAFRARELNGWGDSKWEGLFLLLRGLPFQSIYPEFYNLDHRAINITSMFRWDPEKRRLAANLSSPLRPNPKRAYNVGVDLRSENWDVQSSFKGPSVLLGGFNLRREAVGAGVVSYESGGWSWSVGGELSHRDFRSVIPGPALTSDLLSKGYQLKQVTHIDVPLWRLPEKRFTVDAGASSAVGRIWSDPRHSFLKLQGTTRLHWFPQLVGDDYEVQHQFRAGKTFGDVPFDELYMLGLERDNDLWMRAHVGTRDGRKGSAPLGRSYFLANWELDKNIYSNGLFKAKLGPFVDSGKITDDVPGLGSHKWLWDLGAQAKIKVLGTGVVCSYGKDLRSGNNAFYVALLR